MARGAVQSPAVRPSTSSMVEILRLHIPSAGCGVDSLGTTGLIGEAGSSIEGLKLSSGCKVEGELPLFWEGAVLGGKALDPFAALLCSKSS